MTRQTQIQIRLSDEEKAELERRAGDLSVSEYVRQTILGPTKLDAMAPTGETGKATFEQTDKERLLALAEELAAANGWPMMRARAVAAKQLAR